MNIYDRFIAKYKNQTFDVNEYTEKHHIIPKHIGGDDTEANIIILTYRQHILAHLLLYRVYGRYEDKIAYNLMRGIEIDRKIAIGKLIGEKHKASGHIYKLGRNNVDTGFLESIRTRETCSKGGKVGGAIAKTTGQILTIRTKEGSKLGGIRAGNLAVKRNQIQSLGKFKGEYVLIDPSGVEYQHAFQMVELLNIDKRKLLDWCRNNRFGYSRRPKTKEELDSRWTKQTNVD